MRERNIPGALCRLGKNGYQATIFGLGGLLAQKPWIVPIPGTRKLHRLEENLGAVDVELTSAELANLQDALSEIELVGGRYPSGSDYEKRVGK